MRLFSILSGFLLAGATVAQNSSCAPTSSDAAVVRYACALQGMLEEYYTSHPVNQTFLSDARNSSSAQYYQNLQGMHRENQLGLRALLQIGHRVPGFSNPTCNFSLPEVTSAEEFVENALLFEGSVAAALLGVTGYTQTPAISFVLARLASQHTAHATWLASQQTGVIFMSNSSALLPAYNPMYVLSTGNGTARFGQYLHGCVEAPESPCGQPFYIGPLVGSVGNVTAAAVGPSGSPSASASASISPIPTASPTAAARKLF